jgi:hypothetical protein
MVFLMGKTPVSLVQKLAWLCPVPRRKKSRQRGCPDRQAKKERIFSPQKISPILLEGAENRLQI